MSEKSYGIESAVAAVKLGDFEKLRTIISDTNSKSPQQRAAGMTALTEAMIAFLRVIDCAKKQGVRFKGETLPTEAEMRYSLYHSGARLSRTCQVLINAIVGLRREAPDIVGKMVFRESEPIQAEAKPMPVQVVSMPRRERYTTIERDAAMEIVSSTTIDRDITDMEKPSC